MKEYVKPDLYYENFELSEHVATCLWDMPKQTIPDGCTATSDAGGAEGIVLFGATGSCNLSSTDGELYCWTNGGSDRNVFNS